MSEFIPMTYESALNKSWKEVLEFKPQGIVSVKFLADEYSVDTQAKKVFSLSCNTPAKDFTAILILHYLSRKLAGLAPLTNNWASFKELSGVEGYQDAFHKRVIEPILSKYGKNPEGLFLSLERLPAKKVIQGDVGIVIEALEGVPVLITLWKADEEFGPDANVLFDKSISRIFYTEDIVVLAGIVAHQL